MTKVLHPISYEDSSVKIPEGEGLSDKLSRPDMRRVELDFDLAERMANELPEQKNINENSVRAGLPEIQVSAYEGHVMSMLLQLMDAKRGVEIGTLGGYSTSWMCRALEGKTQAKIDCCELSPKFAQVATQNLVKWSGLFEIHTGPALLTLETKLNGLKDLDFVFIDADKNNYPHYFEWAWSHIRKGGVVLIDNFYLWGGVYFRGEKFPSQFAETVPGGILNEAKWKAMKLLWERIEKLAPEIAMKTILSTSEGLGLIIKK